MTNFRPDLKNISLDSWDHQIFRQNELQVDVLRLDKIHPDISGNKWFKLKYYIEKARQENKQTLVSFGGAYSNHLLALAAMTSLRGLNSIGFIRGEEPPKLSHTLNTIKDYGMKLVFLSRSEFDLKKKPSTTHDSIKNPISKKNENYPDSILIPEGGAGVEGIKGSEEILSLVPKQKYSHFCTAVGTGTTLAGLINSTGQNQKIIGISILKGTGNLEPMDINWVNDKTRLAHVQMVHEYHFGGYAKFDASLTGFMNRTYAESGIPTDFVYTGKLFFAVIRLAEMKLFPPGSRILVLHTGGLQGNRSLTTGLLGF
ncbi:MAG TPA: pyridoxal-phosphate dependent enzyme [Puia sp.]